MARPERVRDSAGTVYIDVECQLTAAEVGGWQSHQTCQRKLAIAVVRNPASGLLTTYQEADASRLVQDLRGAETVVGFNLLAFDLEILRGYAGAAVDGIHAVDLMEHVRASSGQRWSLDDLVAVTLGKPPSSNGNEATEAFRRGHIKACEAICREDVERIALVHRYGIENGVVYAQRSPDSPRVSIPVAW
jgi:DEAD/DEAH box helicase domain-containing protein